MALTATPAGLAWWDFMRNFVWTQSLLTRPNPAGVNPLDLPLVGVTAKALRFAPRAWLRSPLGKPFSAMHNQGLTRLLKALWTVLNRSPAFKTQTARPATYTITHSRGPMARKKQSREQLSAQQSPFFWQIKFPRYRTLSPLHPTLSTPFAQAAKASMLLDTPLAFLDTNLLSLASTTKKLRVLSLHLWLLRFYALRYGPRSCHLGCNKVSKKGKPCFACAPYRLPRT